MTRRPHRLLVALALGLLAPALALPASAAHDRDDEVVELTFPVPGLADERHFTDDFHDERGGGTREHEATDIGAADAYGLPVHAAMGGTVTWITGLDGEVPDYGYALTVEGVDGLHYTYIHLGRQDGPPSEAYAAGLSRGDTVARGQHLGFVGHSGNASERYPHLHFEIEDRAEEEPVRRNPYASLVSALERGDVPAGGFLDVAGTHVHGAAIRGIAAAGITAGCAPARFCPARDVTRGQMATFLQRALDLPGAGGASSEGGASSFSDVPASHTHHDGIAAVAEADIAFGGGDGRFRPDDPVRRDQMASFLARALGLDTSGDEPPFPDVSASSVHAGAIAALAGADIAKGDGAGDYRPARAIDRGQMASFLHRAFLD